MSDGEVGGADLTQWLSIALAAVTGVLVGVGGIFKIAWTMRGKQAELEKEIAKLRADCEAKNQSVVASVVNLRMEIIGLIDQKLAQDRHDNLYPMMQREFVAPLDKLEEEQKRQGQNIAILLERDKIGRQMSEVVSTVHAAVAQMPKSQG